jgi:hypothetical protein
MSTLKVDNLQTTGGVGLYVLRAYINYNPLTTVPSIRANGGFTSSITDNAIGDQTLTFSTAIGDINYTYSGSVGYENQNQSAWVGGPNSTLITNWKTSTFLRINTFYSNAAKSTVDPADVCVLLMR